VRVRRLYTERFTAAAMLAGYANQYSAAGADATMAGGLAPHSDLHPVLGSR
jgi:hypothetical protein